MLRKGSEPRTAQVRSRAEDFGRLTRRSSASLGIGFIDLAVTGPNPAAMVEEAAGAEVGADRPLEDRTTV